MSITLEFSGNDSHLSAIYFPPIELPTAYECGLVSLYTYNSIPNVDKSNNTFHIGTHTIIIPEGSYEIDDLIEYISKKVKELDPNIKLTITPNVNTLKVEILSSHTIYFHESTSIGGLFGYSKRIIKPYDKIESDSPVRITSVNSIRVECNLISGSYVNSDRAHTIHEFTPGVGVGYQIIEEPNNIIYLPVNSNLIHSVDIRLVDQDGNYVNFRNEIITIRLHLRPRI